MAINRSNKSTTPTTPTRNIALNFRFFLFLLLTLTSCTRYRDFTLPPEPGGPPITWHWEPHTEPVLTRGSAQDWDAVDVLNPSVIRQGDAYYSLFSGFDGKTWRTGLAVSADGIEWHKEGPILTPDPATWETSEIAANGSALVDDSTILYYYQGGTLPRTRIGLARSSNGHKWQRQGAPVVDMGPRGSWDEMGVGDPYVIRAGRGYYMFYVGMDRSRRQRLGVAMSDDAVAWHKLRSNPVMELGGYGSLDENGLGEPAVWAAHGYYWMLYTGRDRGEVRRLGLARSQNGVAWEKLPLVIAGDQPWNAKVICDPTVLIEAGRVRVWFGGGDVARPDQNIHGQIGVGSLNANVLVP